MAAPEHGTRPGPKPEYARSALPENASLIAGLRARLHTYYRDRAYHDVFVAGLNREWSAADHGAQLAVARLIPDRARVLEVGCGSGDARRDLERIRPSIQYTGVDLNFALWPGRRRFVSGSVETIPLRSAVFDVALSMFVIEHVPSPRSALLELWRVLAPGGLLLMVAPDFDRNAMPSERLGPSYHTGSTHLRAGRIRAAAETLWHSRVRLPLSRWMRRKALARGRLDFPVLLEPRCFRLDGFTPDCDAVYPSHSEEILTFLRQLGDFESGEVVFRNGSTFALRASKARAALGADPS